jgi:hypothetical protein
MTTNNIATETMTQAQLMAAFRALGCSVRPRSWDRVIAGQVVTSYGVDATLSSMGSTEIVTVRVGELCDPPALVAKMTKELKARVRATKAAIRRERSET